MLTGFSTAAKKIVLTLGLAAFFSSSLAASDNPLNSLEESLSDLVYSLSRSVVAVEASRSVPFQSLGSPLSAAVESHVASGLVIDVDGYVLVAASSVYGRDHFSVSLDNRMVPASLAGIDYVENVALLKPLQPLGSPVRLAARHACAGQMVVSLGNAFGVRASPSIGFCAGMREDGNTQFSIPSGSCSFGGGIFTLSGELLGIIVDNVGQAGRVTVAVPAFRLGDIVSFLKSRGDRHAGFIGIATSEIEVSPAMVIDEGGVMTAAAGRSQGMLVDRGLMVTQILPGSPAERSGMIPGDIVLAIGRQKIATSEELAKMIGRTTPGTRIQVDVIRHNSRLSLPVQVGARMTSLPWMQSADRRAGNANPVADSLFGALERLKEQVSRLEDRLNSLF